jgi:vacuolar-type H+-ATPase subunit I/STV1
MNEEINKIYEKNSSGVDVDNDTGNNVVAIIIIIIFIFIITNLYKKIGIKEMNTSWDNIKCKPRNIFYSGFINSTSGDPIKDTFDNFISCINPFNTLRNKNNKFYPYGVTGVNNINNISQDIINKYNRSKTDLNNINVNKTANVRDTINNVNKIQTSMDLLYNYQQKLYTIIQTYVERLFLVLDVVINYSKDIRVYNLYKLSNQLTSNNNGNNGTTNRQLNTFIVAVATEYSNINSDINNAYDAFNKTKANNGNNYNIYDNYDKSKELIDSAISRYNELSKDLDQFQTANDSKLQQIDDMIEAVSNNVDITRVFPNYNKK